MNTRPIAFTPVNAAAIHAGQKTQTRRILIGPDSPPPPRYQRGDQLWVREPWRAPALFDHLTPYELMHGGVPVAFEAEGPAALASPGRLRPGMFLPRKLARISLVLTGVRVERLQDISADDALAEGAAWWASRVAPQLLTGTPVEMFRALWESINGGSWELNPWVVALTFVRVEQTPPATPPGPSMPSKKRPHRR